MVKVRIRYWSIRMYVCVGVCVCGCVSEPRCKTLN